ncbi:MAG: hypothetical protein ACK5BN_13525, partial [Planctomycetota bacterium]
LHQDGLTSTAEREHADRDERGAAEGVRAAEFAVQVGRTTPGHAEVLGGLAAGDVAVLYPSELLVDGAPVRPQ